jgi:hypothetical protein
MIGAVTAGCASVKAKATWTRLSPALSAKSASRVGGVQLGLVGRVVEVVAGGHPIRSVGPRGVLAALAIRAGEPAAGQRAPRQHTHAVFLRNRQEVGLDAARQDRVRRLFGDEAAEGSALTRPLRLDHLVGGEGGRAERADLALALQIGQS